MKKTNVVLWGLINAVGVLIYVLLVVLFMRNGSSLLGNVDSLISGAVFLLLFVLSATVVGSIVFGKSFLLYLKDQRRDAIKVFLWTVGWIFIATVIALILGAFIL